VGKKEIIDWNPEYCRLIENNKIKAVDDRAEEKGWKKTDHPCNFRRRKRYRRGDEQAPGWTRYDWKSS